MLRSNVIYTILLGILFLGFGLSVDREDEINIDTAGSSHWVAEKAQDDKMILHPLTQKAFSTIDKQPLSPENWDQQEILLMLINLKQIPNNYSSYEANN